MNCQKFESLTGELARGQMMEADLRSEALAHSAGCSTCSSRLRDEELLSVGLKSLATEMNSLTAPASIEARLLGTFRQHQVVVPLATAKDHRRYWLAAVAALLLIVFGVIAVRWRGGSVQQQAYVAPSVPEKSTTVVKDETPAKNETTANPQKRKLRPRLTFNRPTLQARAGSARNKNNNVVANHANNEIATDFVPVGYLNVAALQDGGQIVRVELPRTALANFGFPVNMDRYNEKVKADILLGVDGMAHAIRFVQEKRMQ
jgi:hypothetical protein